VFAIRASAIAYESILLCDDLGDVYHEGPHLLVEYNNRACHSCLHVNGSSLRISGGEVQPDPTKRISVFPNEIPDEREVWQAEIKQRIDERHKRGRTWP
jgi:hypothetical protein